MTDATFADKARMGQPVALSGNYADADTTDTHTAVVDWGDGTSPEPLSVIGFGGAGSFMGVHQYANGGVFTVTVTLFDDNGNSDTESTTAVVTGVGLNNGTLQIIGTRGKDQVQVSDDGKKLKVQADLKSGRIKLEKSFKKSKVNRIEIVLCEGDDQAQVGSGRHQTYDHRRRTGRRSTAGRRWHGHHSGRTR